MNKKLTSTILALVAVLIFFIAIWQIGGAINSSLQLDQTALLRFVFVIIGMLIVLLLGYNPAIRRSLTAELSEVPTYSKTA